MWPFRRYPVCLPPHQKICRIQAWWRMDLSWRPCARHLRLTRSICDASARIPTSGTRWRGAMNSKSARLWQGGSREIPSCCIAAAAGRYSHSRIAARIVTRSRSLKIGRGHDAARGRVSQRPPDRARDRWKGAGLRGSRSVATPVGLHRRVGAKDYSFAPLTEPDMRATHPALWIDISEVQRELDRNLRRVKVVPHSFERGHPSGEPCR